MRVIAKRYLDESMKKYPTSRVGLQAWFAKVQLAEWQDMRDVRQSFPTADYVPNRHFDHLTVFNIKGNDYRLAVDIHFLSGSIYLKWFGTHASYSKVSLNYVKNTIIG